MPSTVIIALSAMLVLLAFNVNLALYLRAKAARPEPKPPPEPSMNVIARNISQAIKEAVVETNASTARAMGDAMQAMLASPPSEKRDEVLDRVQHELNQWIADADVDDSDPIGDGIMPRAREDAAFVDKDDLTPFGIPGMAMPTPSED